MRPLAARFVCVAPAAGAAIQDPPAAVSGRRKRLAAPLAGAVVGLPYQVGEVVHRGYGVIAGRCGLEVVRAAPRVAGSGQGDEPVAGVLAAAADGLRDGDGPRLVEVLAGVAGALELGAQL